MSCGCQIVQTPALEAAARGAMCAACPHGERRGGATVACTLNGQALPAFAKVKTSRCPERRWPDVNGMVTWMGNAQWIGVPDPLRWKLAMRLRREPRVPGCGCHLKLKTGRWGRWLDPWMELSPALRAWVVGFLQEWDRARERMRRVES